MLRHFWISPHCGFPELVYCFVVQLGASLAINFLSPNVPVAPEDTTQIFGTLNSEFSQALKPVEPAEATVWWYPPFPRALSKLPLPLSLACRGTLTLDFLFVSPDAPLWLRSSPFCLPNCPGDYLKLNANFFTGRTKLQVFLFSLPDLQKHLSAWKLVHFLQMLLVVWKILSLQIMPYWFSSDYSACIQCTLSAFAHYFLFLTLKWIPVCWLDLLNCYSESFRRFFIV